MRCPKCAGIEDKVIDSRSSKEGAVIRRRRECTGCQHRFTTYEEIEHQRLMVVKRGQVGGVQCFFTIPYLLFQGI